MKKSRPILITGSHRSGTTFTGKILSLPKNIGYISEPFNKFDGIDGIEKWFLYIREGMADEEKYYKLFKNFLNGRTHFKKREFSKRVYRNWKYRLSIFNPRIQRLLIKDPIASLSSEWLHRKFNMDVVVLIRHPVAFIGSIKRLNFAHPFDDFLSQSDLVNDHLGQFVDSLKNKKLSYIEKSAILWNCIYSVLYTYLQRNPGMIYVKHEELSYSPTETFRYLYNKLGLRYSIEIDNSIIQYTQNKKPVDLSNRKHNLKRNSIVNVSRWKKIFSQDDVRIINEITWDLSSKFYSLEEW